MNVLIFSAETEEHKVRLQHLEQKVYELNNTSANLTQLLQGVRGTVTIKFLSMKPFCMKIYIIISFHVMPLRRSDYPQ